MSLSTYPPTDRIYTCNHQAQASSCVLPRIINTAATTTTLTFSPPNLSPESDLADGLRLKAERRQTQRERGVRTSEREGRMNSATTRLHLFIRIV